MSIYKVGIIGFGYWGRILARSFSNHNGFRVDWICDRNNENLEAARDLYADIKISSTYTELVNDSNVDAIVIATQASTHYSLCRDALLSSKHVFVEKPFVLSYAEAVELFQLSEKRGKNIFVDHIWLYSPVYLKFREIIRRRELGKVLRISSRRCDFGLFQNDANVMWHLMYHDIYMLNDLLGTNPISLHAYGSSALSTDVVDGAVAILDYSSNIMVTIYCDLYYPSKVREYIVQCEKGILIWDEMSSSKLTIVDKYASNEMKSNKVAYHGTGEKTVLLVDDGEVLPYVLSDFYKTITGEFFSDYSSVLQTMKIIEMLNCSMNVTSHE